MSRATRTLLKYLRAYLDEKPGRRTQLMKFHQKKLGSPLNSGNLARHLMLANEPNLSTGLVYISYLREEKELIPGKKQSDPLFIYVRETLLK